MVGKQSWIFYLVDYCYIRWCYNHEHRVFGSGEQVFHLWGKLYIQRGFVAVRRRVGEGRVPPPPHPAWNVVAKLVTLHTCTRQDPHKIGSGVIIVDLIPHVIVACITMPQSA